MTAQHCKTCRYFSQEGFREMGVCKRYPVFQNRNSTDWCGEYNQILATTITLPKVDLEFSKTGKHNIEFVFDGTTQKLKATRPFKND